MAAFELSEINVYPVKSLGGISLKQANAQARGFEHDRRWMIVDETGKYQTQRQNSNMTLASVQINKDSLQIQAPGFSTLKIPFQPETNDWLDVTIWEKACKAQVVSQEANAWVSEFMQMKCLLVFMPDSINLQIDPVYNINNGITSFSDGYPYLLIGQASLDDLNSKLETPVPMKRFRPNIVVTGSEAFAEDSLQKIKIGSVQFHVAKPCARCVVTTIDPETAQRGKEPLTTLNTYRNVNGQVLFGMNLIPEQTGVLTIGDPVIAE